MKPSLNSTHQTSQIAGETRMLLATVALATLLHQSDAVAQGSLTPPGPPAPTMKTLDQIEPRKPISALPYIINTPGSYYLTSNLTGTSGCNGISINTSDVTIDLAGFSLVGVPGSFSGISAGSQTTNISIRNGTLRAWGNTGVEVYLAAQSQLERLKCFGNGTFGLHAGPGSAVKDCVAQGNAFSGIRIGNGCLVTGCLSQTNGETGFVIESGVTIKDCTAQGNVSDGFNAENNCLVSGCLSVGNGTYGAAVGYNNVVTANNIVSNSYVGLFFYGANRIEANSLIGNRYGFIANGTNNLIIRNSASGNNGSDYGGMGGNTMGPIVTSANIATSSNPHANYQY